MLLEGPEARGTEEGGVLRGKTGEGRENAEKELWAVGHTGEGKARGKAGPLTASESQATSLSRALATKDGATVRGARCSAGSREGYFDSRLKQEPSLHLKH